jgi:formate/nitrite transporter FocA (FNT family)
MAAQNPLSEAGPVSLDTKRRTAHEIFDEATELARGELERPPKALAFSGVAGGLTIGLTGLAVAAARAELGGVQSAHFIAQLFYPIGFIAVIIGRAQLFTENTLFPVVLVLSERRYFLQTLRLWMIVYFGNLAGAILFGLLMARTHAVLPDIGKELAVLGMESAAHPVSTIFWTGVIGGWLIALVAWMVTASHWTIGQIMVIWLLAFVVGVGHFAHCIATSGEIMTAVFAGHIPFSQYLRWIVPATAGNIVGGVMIVSLLNWGQVKAGLEER